MHGSLALHRGTLFVGRHEKTAHVAAFDLDGRELAGGFSFRDPRGRSSASGLAVDDDRQIWVADDACGRLRRFTLFGRELEGLGRPLDQPLGPDPSDRAGQLTTPVAVAVHGDRDGARVVVGQAGVRRHGVQVFDEAGRLVRSLRPMGDRHGTFRDVSGVALDGRLVYVAESGASRVEVFRDLDFHFAFGLEGTEDASEPRALVPVGDGRLVVAAGALLLFDRNGRRLRVLARGGAAEGQVDEPSDVVLAPAADDRETRLAVVDQEGTRIQVLNLEGRFYGAFSSLPSSRRAREAHPGE